MEKKILVPLDGTEVGEAVLPKIEDLLLRTTPKLDAEVTLLRVISKINFNVLTHDERAQLPMSEAEAKEVTENAQNYLKTVAEKLTKQGINTKVMVAMGNAAEEIVKAAHEINASLIAMSSHGRNGIIRWAIGSVTDRVLRLEGTIPVLAVRAQQEKEKNPVIALESLQSMVKHT